MIPDFRRIGLDSPPGAQVTAGSAAARFQGLKDTAFRLLCQAAAVLVVFLMVALVAVLVWRSWDSLRTNGLAFFTSVLRALAGVYERQGRLSRAIALWEVVRKADPSDPDASRKIYDLAASETIARNQFKKRQEGD